MTLLSKKDYNALVTKITKEGFDVNKTYELTGFTLSYKGTTKDVMREFEIENEFERKFVHSIATFTPDIIGPYITAKYMHLIPAVKIAAMHLSTDCEESRRCVVDFPDEHCFRSIQFLYRDSGVEVVCFMRSCDIIKNLPYDLWLCSKLADIFAKHISEPTHPFHKITITFGSLHVYKEDL